MKLFKLDPSIFPPPDSTKLPPLFTTTTVSGVKIEKEQGDINHLAYTIDIITDVYRDKFFAASILHISLILKFTFPEHMNFFATPKNKPEQYLVVSVLKEISMGAVQGVINSRKVGLFSLFIASLTAGFHHIPNSRTRGRVYCENGALSCCPTQSCWHLSCQ